MKPDLAKVYLTGAAGMIGSNIAHALVAAGVAVVGIDNLWRGRRENIADLEHSGLFEFRRADIMADPGWDAGLDESCGLIHTADIVGGIGYVFDNEWSIFQRNNLINTQVAQSVRARKPRRFIYIGTACSYPQALQRSVDASQLSEKQKFPADPESGYGWSKLIGEIEFTLAVKDIDTRLTVLDFHNVYGWPCIHEGPTTQVIPSLIHRAIKSRDGVLQVWGNGRQGRAFLHVRDAVRAVQMALGYDGAEKNFMIGPGHCTTIGEVARLIQQHPGLRISEIRFDTSKPVGDIGRFADASLAARELGWRPTVEFQAGLHELIDHILADCEARAALTS